MVDPATAVTALTAAKIVELAFTKAIESGAGEAAKKLTEATIAKMNDLRKKIWAKLRGKSLNIDEALDKAEQGDHAAVGMVAEYLDVAMVDYPDFAAEIRAIAHEITVEQHQDNSSMNQTNYGGTNYQTKAGENNTNFFGGSHQHGK